MAAGWVPVGPDQAAQAGNTPADTSWTPVGPDAPGVPSAPAKPVPNAIENDPRSTYQKGRDLLFGHEPDKDDTDRVYKPGIFPSIAQDAKDLPEKINEGPEWQTLATSYPHQVGAHMTRVKAGYEEATGAHQVQNAEAELAALNVLPQAINRLRGPGAVPDYQAIAKDPLVKQTAISLGMAPLAFASQYGTEVQGMSQEQQADRAAAAQQALVKGKDNVTLGKGNRAQAWADERAWTPADKLNGKLDPTTVKGAIFNIAVGVPDLIAVAGATVGVSAATGNPALGMAAGAGTAAAIFAPEQRAQVKDKIDDQVDRIMARADAIDAQAPVGGKRGLNPVTTQLRQQGADLAASSDKIADTAGFLYAVSDAAGATPLGAVLSRAPGGQALLNKVLGTAIAKTAGGRIATTVLANGAGGVIQTALQKGVDAGIVHENQGLGDALKDIAYSGVIASLTALPIAGVHESLQARGQAHADAQASRDFETDQFAETARQAAHNYGAEAAPPGQDPNSPPGYQWNESTHKYEPTGTNGANPGTKPALPATNGANGETNQPNGATPSGPGGTRQAYQDKVDTLNTAAAAAEKRSDVQLVPAEDGWEIHVKGQAVASFDNAVNARQALADARKLVGSAPAANNSQNSSTQGAAQPTDTTQQPSEGGPAAAKQSQTGPGKPTTLKDILEAGESARVPEDALERTQPVPPERRSNAELRTRVNDMTLEQAKAALTTHELTGIPNRRAYEDSAKKPAQVSVDVDSLKWMNDNAGHEAGDHLLKAVAKALHEASGGNAYHISGDEFVVQGDTAAEAESVLARAKDRLAGATLLFEHPDGRQVELKGIGVSHGTGNTLEQADARLAQAKAGRELSGERAGRGEQPPGASSRAPQAGVPPEDRESTAGGASPSRRREPLDVLGQRVQAPDSPSDGQAAAGNYFKPAVHWHGIPIKIENAAGSSRAFTYPNGRRGARTMRNHYGYFPGKTGADGDGVDVFMGPAKSGKSGRAYVIDQLTPGGRAFDEHKVVVGVSSAAEAKKLYLSNYQKDWQGFGAITPMEHGELAGWLAHGDLTKPVAWHEPVKRAAPQVRGPDAAHDSVLQYLARHERGLDSEEAVRQGIDPADMRLAAAHVGIKRAFRKGGMTFDEAAEHLHEAGYPVHDKDGHYNPNTLLDKIDDELRGKKHYSVHNQGHTEEIAHEAMERALDVSKPASAAELEAMSPAELQARLDALEAENERLAIQAESQESEHARAEDLDAIPFAKGQQDLFGAQTHVKTELKKLEAALDRKRNSGQVSVETGDPGDLFSQARQQADLTDIKEPATEYRGGGKPEQLSIFAAGAAPAAKRAAIELAQKTKLATVGTFRSGHAVIDTWQKAAHVIAPIRKGAQETMVALVLDKAGKPITVIRSGLGTINSQSVESWSITGAIGSVPGAASVYFAHNHPSSNLQQSMADNIITARLAKLTNAMGIKAHGMIVMTPHGYQVSYVPADHFQSDQDSHIGNKDVVEFGGKTKATVPYTERKIAGRLGKVPGESSPLGMRMHGPKESRAIIEKTGLTSGVLLLDNAHNVVGMVPMSTAEMSALKVAHGNSPARTLLTAAHQANANTLVAFSPTARPAHNVARLGNASGIRSIDTFHKDSDGDWVSGAVKGEVPEEQDTLFNRLSDKKSTGMAVGDVKAHVGKILENFRVKPDVVVVADARALARVPDLQGRLSPNTIGTVDPTTGKIYLVANEMHSPEHVALMMAHEYIVHYGMRAAFGNRRQAEYQEILDGVAKAMPAETELRFGQAFPGADFKTATPNQRMIAAEEALAYTAERHFADPDGAPAKAKRWLVKFWDMIRDWGRRVLGLKAPFDQAFVRRTLDDLKAFLKKGHPGATDRGEESEPASAQAKDTFYSGLARAVDAAKRDKGTGAEWEATLKNTPGVKKEEMEWLGLKDFLADRGRVTKAEVAEYVNAHRVQLGEVHMTDNEENHQALLDQALEKIGWEARWQDGSHWFIDPEGTEHEAGDLPPNVAQAIADVERGGAARYKTHATPGGENYSEMLMTLAQPERPSPTHGGITALPNGKFRVDAPGLQSTLHNTRLEAYERTVELGRKFATPNPEDFHSAHWDTPNVLAHVRFDDREGPNGERVLHVHEIQSDWHQAGRRQGYGGTRATADRAEAINRRLVEIQEEINGATPMGVAAHRELIVERDALRDELEGGQASRVPDAPFKTTWPELAMKRMLRMAAEEGYDAISWDTGDTNAERYNMSHVVDTINARRQPSGLYRMVAIKDGKIVREESSLSEEHLAALIGKDAAQKIISQAGDGVVKLKGEDLKVGGHGMRGFYDDILPKKVNALVKKWGGSVEPATLPGRDLDIDITHADQPHQYQIESRGGQHVAYNPHDQFDFREFPTLEEAQAFAAANRTNGVPLGWENTGKDVVPTQPLPVHMVKITPAMRDSVLEGQPMFRKKGTASAAPIPKGPGPARKVYDIGRRVATLIPTNELTLSFRRILDPAGVSDFAKATSIVTRENLGELAQAKEAALVRLEEFAKTFDQLPIKDSHEFIFAMEEGKPQPNVALQPAADAIRHMLDTAREQVRELGVGALDNWIENYFPHIWKDPTNAGKIFKQIFGRRPMKGPASFLKERTIPTTREGLDKGLIPVSNNPLVLAFAKVVEMHRFIGGVKLMQRLKDEGLAKFLPGLKKLPADWDKIKDAVGTVLQWNEEEGAFMIRGYYIMPADAARVINNHFGRSALADFLPTTLFKVATSAVSALQLGFSAFHLGFTTLDAIISKNALGIERLLHGEPLRAAAALMEANGVLAGPAMNLARGYKLLKAYTATGVDPEMHAIVKGLMAAGGRIKMDNYFAAARGVSPFKGTGFATLAGEVKAALTLPQGKMAELGKVMGGFPRQYAQRLWRDLVGMSTEMRWPWLTVPIEIAGRVTRASTAIVMEHIVPLQKLGVFADLAGDWLRRNPEADPVSRADAMQKAWDSVDNRLGEMVYDNVFWNRTFKDVNHMMVRAVGWNLGTVRELGGAPVDVIKLLDYIARGAPAEPSGAELGHTAQARMEYEQAKAKLDRVADKVGHKIPYTLALVGTTMLLGAILTYLMTGKAPEELKDYFFPPTGRLTKYGTKERMSMPSYAKDMYEYGTQPMQTVINKANPIFGIIHAIYANEDFFGNPIRHTDASAAQQIAEGAKYAGRESLPFSVQGGMQYQEAGTSVPLAAAPYVGFGPAPARVTSPEQMERYQHEEEQKGWVRSLVRQMRKAQEAGNKAEVDRLRNDIMEAKTKERETEREIKETRAKARAAAAKISQLIDGKSKQEAVAKLRDAGMPALAALWEQMPERPRMRVAQSLQGFA